MWKIILAAMLVCVGGLAVALVALPPRQKPATSTPQVTRNESTPLLTDTRSRLNTTPQPAPEIKNILLSVPFTVQAPSGQWNDPLFQDGCEEAAMIMAHAWVTGTSLTPAGVEEEIKALAAYQQKIFGHAHDTSAADTAQLMRDYYHYQGVSTRSDIDIEDIKLELARGNLAVAPVDGQKLKNPHYTRPGPQRHMLVIIGYDTKSKEFVTNDSGTKRGQGYRYPQELLGQALRDYPTGIKKPIMEQVTAMIIVKPPKQPTD